LKEGGYVRERVAKLTLTDLWKKVNEDFWGEISLGTQKMVERLMEVTLGEEMAAYVDIGRYVVRTEGVFYRPYGPYVF